MKQFFYYLTILLAITIVTSCEFEEPKDFVPDQEDASGNLLIINNSNERLVLYKDEYLVKKIPASASDFLVFIDNPDESTVQLDIYLWDDVKDDINNPNPSSAYKRWLVPLSSSTAIEEQATWHINGNTEYLNSATVNFSYFGGTEYNVNVFLNGINGAKILSLKPGDQYKRVGVDYGNFTVAYEYWVSNPNDNQAKDESKTVWIDKEEINGEEVSIWLVLNENRSDVTTIIPHNGVDAQKQSFYAYIKVTNDKANPVVIKAGDNYIENVCYLEGNKQNFSTIPSKGSTTFIMPISDINTLEETFILSAYDVEGRFVEEITFTLTEEESVSWMVDGIEDGTE